MWCQVVLPLLTDDAIKAAKYKDYVYKTRVKQDLPCTGGLWLVILNATHAIVEHNFSNIKIVSSRLFDYFTGQMFYSMFSYRVLSYSGKI